MAIVQRYNGNSEGVTNVDKSIAGATYQIVSFIGKHPIAYKIVFAADASAQMGTGGAIEAVLRTVQVAGTTLAYQLDTVQLSVLCEASGWVDDAALQAAIVALGTVNGFALAGTTVSSANGMKLA